MAPVPQTSFVPRQQPGNPVVKAPRRERRRLNILSFFAIVIFFGSLILSVGVFILKQATAESLTAKQKELSDKRSLFKRDDIESVQLLDARIRAADYLLESHVSPSKLLAVLETNTQEEIQYINFAFERRPSGNVGVSMEGVAPRFNTVARQAQRFSDEKLFRRVIFANLNKPSSSHVSFSVDVDITRDAIAYEAALPVPDTATSSSASTESRAASSAPAAVSNVINDAL